MEILIGIVAVLLVVWAASVLDNGVNNSPEAIEYDHRARCMSDGMSYEKYIHIFKCGKPGFTYYEEEEKYECYECGYICGR